MRTLLTFLLVLASCSSSSGENETQRSVVTPQSRGEYEEETEKEDRALQAEHTAIRLKSKPVDVDPYDGWKNWCEPAAAPCMTDADCSSTKHPSGKKLECVQPWYGKGKHDRVCAPGWSTRGERAYQRARIRELVRLQYSGEASCTGPCSGKRARGDRLARFLNLVAQRETTMRPWKRHRLNGDLRANRASWGRHAERYGHSYKDREAGGRFVAFSPEGNRHYAQRTRWEYGMGLYGMNAAIFTRSWDQAAPPEVLCLEVPGTEAYLRTARRAWRKLSGGIDCDGDGHREWHGTGGSPTLHDVHRAASSGQLCPGAKRNFDTRAISAGLDPYRAISLADLGTPIDRERQIEHAADLLSELESFSEAWDASASNG